MSIRVSTLIGSLALLLAQAVFAQTAAPPKKIASAAKPGSSGAGGASSAAASSDIKLGEDEPGCKDSTLLPRVTGCSIIQCDSKDFGTVNLQIASSPADGTIEKDSMDGPVETLYYLCPAKLSLASLVKQNEAALVKNGFKSVYNGKDEDDEPLATLSKDTQWVEISTYTYNQYSAYVVTAVQAVPETSSEDMVDQITKVGRTVLDTLAFENEKAELPLNAEKVLAEVVDLLKQMPELKVRVEGYNNDSATKEANVELSKKRATAVAGWLVEHGIEQSRVSAEGLGDAKPAAETKSTRIEIVKI